MCGSRRVVRGWFKKSPVSRDPRSMNLPLGNNHRIYSCHLEPRPYGPASEKGLPRSAGIPPSLWGKGLLSDIFRMGASYAFTACITRTKSRSQTTTTLFAMPTMYGGLDYTRCPAAKVDSSRRTCGFSFLLISSLTCREFRAEPSRSG